MHRSLSTLHASAFVQEIVRASNVEECAGCVRLFGILRHEAATRVELLPPGDLVGLVRTDRVKVTVCSSCGWGFRRARPGRPRFDGLHKW